MFQSRWARLLALEQPPCLSEGEAVDAVKVYRSSQKDADEADRTADAYEAAEEIKTVVAAVMEVGEDEVEGALMR